MFNLFNHYAVGICLLFILLCESIIISWIFTIDKINEKLNETTGENIGPFFKFVLKYITPALAGISLLLGIIDEFSNPLSLPAWAVLFGIFLILLPISFAIYGFTCGKDRLIKEQEKKQLEKDFTDLDKKTKAVENDDDEIPADRQEQLRAKAHEYATPGSES